ncbi:hypothetical protein KFK09_006631 [Dendrobium nobile]|uniref:Uncharacterized protein n=1 Tax=Dendrobium nobile TaxID=94219 RepID=A0A8T3BS54_DENNO|nr:hypothetical protein KFK09_006631 [Dendrobium nobile]
MRLGLLPGLTPRVLPKCRPSTMVFQTLVSCRLRFFRPPSTDNNLSDPGLLPTTIIRISVSCRLWSFRLLSPDNSLSNLYPIDYGCAD